MNLSLQNKIIVVSGGAKGIGEGIVKLLAAEGAVAVIIGGAFGAIVSSLVDNVITPLLLTPALKAANAQDLDKLTYGAVKYGLFLAAIIKFVIIAFILFLIVKGVKAIENKKVPAAAEPSATE